MTVAKTGFSPDWMVPVAATIGTVALYGPAIGLPAVLIGYGLQQTTRWACDKLVSWWGGTPPQKTAKKTASASEKLRAQLSKPRGKASAQPGGAATASAQPGAAATASAQPGGAATASAQPRAAATASAQPRAAATASAQPGGAATASAQPRAAATASAQPGAAATASAQPRAAATASAQPGGAATASAQPRAAATASAQPRRAAQPAFQAAAAARSQPASDNLSSIGIVNRGTTCFINACMQSEILDNPILVSALKEARELGGPTFEAGVFAETYKEDQKDQRVSRADGEKVRDALVRVTRDPRFWGGQHDPRDVRANLLLDPQLVKLLMERDFYRNLTTRRYFDVKGMQPVDLQFDPIRQSYYSATTEQSDGVFEAAFPLGYRQPMPLKEIFVNALQGVDDITGAKYEMRGRKDKVECEGLFFNSQWERAPHELIIGLKRWHPETLQKIQNRVIADERMTLEGPFFADGKPRTYQLKSFIKHIGEGKDSGHYVTYKQEPNGEYVLLNDERRTVITKELFFKKATEGYRFKYTLVP